MDAVTGIAYLPSRSDYATFTKPYLSFPVAVIMRENSPFFIRMAALKNKTATLPRDYVTTAFVESTLPSVQVLYVDSSAEALGMVSSGKSDFTVENLASASYIIRRNGFSNLKIAALTSVSFDHRIAVRDDWPILASILDKALHAIPESSKAAILEEWLPVEVDTTINWPYIFRIAGAIFLACVLILVVSLAWNRRIANELEERRKIEAELREKTERLDALSKQKDEFMAMAAHDLNSPLTQIMLASEVLGMRLPPDDKNAKHLIEDILSGAQRMTRLIRNLLSLHAIESGRLQDSKNECNVAQVLQEVTRRHIPSAEIKDIKITSACCSDHLSAAISSDALDQILDNLLGNAIKYSPVGSHVETRAAVVDGKIVCEVADDGQGFPPEVAASLFDDGTRPSNKPTGGEISNGLGLSIVKRLCHQTNTQVACESKGTGHGSTFRVTLQAADEVLHGS